MVMALLGSAIFMGSAHGQTNTGAGLAVRPDFPPAVTVGQKAVAVDVVIQNTSQHAQGKVTLAPGAIRSLPSCGSFRKVVEPCPNPDAGVFATSASGTGRAATNCAGAAFSIAAVAGSTTGQVQFNGPGIVLDATDVNDNSGASASLTSRLTLRPLLWTPAGRRPVGPDGSAGQRGRHDRPELASRMLRLECHHRGPRPPPLTTQASPPVTLGAS